jgi:hypothetical protein
VETESACRTPFGSIASAEEIGAGRGGSAAAATAARSRAAAARAGALRSVERVTGER